MSTSLPDWLFYREGPTPASESLKPRDCVQHPYPWVYKTKGASADSKDNVLRLAQVLSMALRQQSRRRDAAKFDVQALLALDGISDADDDRLFLYTMAASMCEWLAASKTKTKTKTKTKPKPSALFPRYVALGMEARTDARHEGYQEQMRQVRAVLEDANAATRVPPADLTLTIGRQHVCLLFARFCAYVGLFSAMGEGEGEGEAAALHLRTCLLGGEVDTLEAYASTVAPDSVHIDLFQFAEEQEEEEEMPVTVTEEDSGDEGRHGVRRDEEDSEEEMDVTWAAGSD